MWCLTAVYEVVETMLWALSREHGGWIVVDWVSNKQNHVASWGKMHKTRNLPGITLVIEDFFFFFDSKTLFLPELSKSQSLSGSLE